MNNVLVRCSRCNRDIEGIKSEGFTGGFYEATGWEKYCDDGESIVCDDCMHWDRRYQKDYGKGIMNDSAPYGFLAQWKEFRLHYPDARYTPNNNLLNIKFPFFAQIAYTEKKIPQGFNFKEVEVRFDINVGYPVTKPKEFWMNENLRNDDGTMAWLTYVLKDSLGKNGTYTLHRIEKWNPNMHTLLTIARTIRRRFSTEEDCMQGRRKN